jgi:hypothetical protein
MKKSIHGEKLLSLLFFLFSSLFYELHTEVLEGGARFARKEKKSRWGEM